MSNLMDRLGRLKSMVGAMNLNMDDDMSRLVALRLLQGTAERR